MVLRARKPIVIARFSNKNNSLLEKAKNVIVGAFVVATTTFGSLKTINFFKKPEHLVREKGTVINIGNFVDSHASSKSNQSRVFVASSSLADSKGWRKHAMRERTPNFYKLKPFTTSKGFSRTSILFPKNPISASFIDAELARNGSPAFGLGKKFVEFGRKYNIDPAVALAFFRMESFFGTKGIAVVNKSIGNIRYSKSDSKDSSRNYSNNNGFRKYDSWEAGLEDFFKHLAESKHYIRAGRTTVEEIVPIYAPPTENDTTNYIRKINAFIREYNLRYSSSAQRIAKK